MRLEFGEWLPDLPDHLNPGALRADNVIPGPVSYLPQRKLQPFTDGLSADVVGGIWARSRGGELYTIIGTKTGIFRLGRSTFTDLSKSGGYSVDRWEFALFGNRIIAVGGIDQPTQYYDMDSASDVRFADLPNAPRAAHIATVRDFVVMGDIRREAGAVREQDVVIWSGFNNSEAWTRSLATQSGSQPLFGTGGALQRLVSGDSAHIFEEGSIWRMEAVEPPVTFRFDEISVNRGTPAPLSVVRLGFSIFFYSHDGFYRLDTRTSEMTPIGRNKVDRYFDRQVSGDAIDGVLGVADRRNLCIIWFYKTSPSLTTFDRYIAYGWKTNRWTGGDAEATFVTEFVSAATTLEEIDTLFGNDIEDLDFSLDAEFLQGGDINVLAFSSDNEAGTFSGAWTTAVVDSKEFSQEDRMLFVRGCRPLVEGGSGGSITPITRNRLGDQPVAGEAASINSLGRANFRKRARYFRFRLTSSTAFTHAVGVEVDPKVKGRR